MKHKITRRLVFYFSSVLLLFSFFISALFLVFSARHTAQIREQELKKRAVSMAETLSDFMQPTRRGHGMMGGLGAYLSFMDDIAGSQVWLVDQRAQTIQMGHMGDMGHMGHMEKQRSALSVAQLPPAAEKVVARVFEGDVEVTGEFSSLLGESSITVGAPVRYGQGDIGAVLLLHSPVDGVAHVERDSAIIFISCVLSGLVLSVLLSVLLARHFIDPLQKMEMAANRLMKGEYSVKTGVSQDDEIGSLARNMDLLALRLSEAEQERENLEKLRRDFVSNISHELRTPVTVLRGSLEVLEEGMVTEPEEMHSYFRQMLTDTIHLQRLVNDLLELSRLQNSDFQIENSRLNLWDVLSEAVRSMRRVSEQKQVEITLDNRIGAVPLTGDYGRLRQMFTIVLDNAVKFSPLGERVEVRMDRGNGGIIVSVRDYGKGIRKEDVPYIFDRFYSERTEDNRTGTGLGLSIAKQIAERHGAAIECESGTGNGACFLFVFPAYF